MGVPTPFHSRTAPLCASMRWTEWAGFFAPEKYDTVHDGEVLLLRHAAGLMDISPLFKYDIRGREARPFLQRLLARDVGRLGWRQVGCACLCDEAGHVIDIGLVACLDEEWFRLTTAHANLRWLTMNAPGFEVSVEDISRATAALALAGPQARDVLQDLMDEPLADLKYFHLLRGCVGNVPSTVTRTGRTGDLGYEIWTDARHAEHLWDLISGSGRRHGLGPVGLMAVDVARVEAGLPWPGVDWTSAREALTKEQKCTPYELGLGWTVDLDRDWFVGRPALAREQARGTPMALVGLELDGDELERLYQTAGLTATLSSTAWHGVVPVFDGTGGRQVGRATSGVWSVLLKRSLALATVERRFAAPGTVVRTEVLVAYERRTVTARVVQRPFYTPPQKRAVGTATIQA